MKILAIDDEHLSLHVLYTAIKESCPSAEVYGFSNPKELLAYAREYQCDVVFLDIDMKTMTGIELAKHLKEIQPQVNLVFVTGYSEYTLDAFSLRASGYVLKPASKEKIDLELQNLRNPIEEKIEHVSVQTFGNFELLVDGVAVKFYRSKAKELLAYLIDRNGAGVTSAELAAVLWEDKEYSRSLQHQVQTIVSSLMRTLREYKIEDIVLKKWNSISVNKGEIQCDLYDYIDGKVKGLNAFRGEYMTNYSWAEYTTGWITGKKE